jgi:hypothetical protein
MVPIPLSMLLGMNHLVEQYYYCFLPPIVTSAV